MWKIQATWESWLANCWPLLKSSQRAVPMAGVAVVVIGPGGLQWLQAAISGRRSVCSVVHTRSARRGLELSRSHTSVRVPHRTDLVDRQVLGNRSRIWPGVASMTGVSWHNDNGDVEHPPHPDSGRCQYWSRAGVGSFTGCPAGWVRCAIEKTFRGAQELSTQQT